jgi:hypothetical protein
MLHLGDVYDVMKILIVALMMMMMVHPPTHPTTIVVSRKLKKIPMKKKKKKKWKLKIHQMVVTVDYDHDDLHGCEEIITKMMMTMKKEKLLWIFMTF